MKNLVLLFALMMTSVYAEVCLEGRSTTVDLLGNVVNQEICYVNVKNGLGSSIAKGNAVILKAGVEDGFTVTTSATAGAVPHCIMLEACADTKVCKCQTYGYADYLDFDSTNGVATDGGLIFISEDNAGYVESEALGSIAASDNPIGSFLESVSASGEVKAFIKLR